MGEGGLTSFIVVAMVERALPPPHPSATGLRVPETNELVEDKSRPGQPT
jgi:hypothetical protein